MTFTGGLMMCSGGLIMWNGGFMEQRHFVRAQQWVHDCSITFLIIFKWASKQFYGVDDPVSIPFSTF